MSKAKKTTVSQRKKVPKKLQGILWSADINLLWRH